MNPKQELEQLSDEYRRLCYMALEACEQGNMGGMGRAHTQMLLNYGKRLKLVDFKATLRDPLDSPTAIELLDSCTEIIELSCPDFPTAQTWKKWWLKHAKRLISQHVAQTT